MNLLRRRHFLLCFYLFGVLAVISLNGWSRGGGGCFEQGTLISSPQGFQLIESLHPGDWVWSNVQGKHQKAKVVATTKVMPKSYLEFKLKTGIIHVTDEHLFAIKQGVFLRAANLKSGDKVIIWHNNHWKTVAILGVKRVKADKPAFNLLVDSGATYFANGVLVHNKGCFLPNTPILRADGLSTAINKIRPGDRVRAYETDGTIVTTKVRAVLKHQVNSYYVVSTKTSTLNVTGEHPFYIGNGSFKTVEALHTGDLIYVFDGSQLKTDHITHIDKINATTMVFNLQTDEPHTYFAAGVAVHNKGGGGGGGCFPAGTKIQTPKGNKSIELLTPGDLVLSVNRNGQEFVTRVKSTFATRSKTLIIETNLGTLHTTGEHPVARQDGSFSHADKLKVHDVILFKKSETVLPAVIKSLHSGSEQVVFNLSVQSPHTYIADDFLVHNKGGGSSRGGSGDFNPMEFFIICTFIIVYLWYQQRKTTNENLDYNYSRKNIELKSDKTIKLLNFIAQQDKTMVPAELERRVRSVFNLLQDSWTRRNYKPMETLLMPDLYLQHTTQISGMIRNHEINRIDRLQIIKIDLVHVRYTEKKEQREFTALITASARDFYVDDRTKKYIRGDQEPETFQEFWTFQLQESGWLLLEIEQTRESDYLQEENFCEQFTDGQIEKIYQDKVDNLGVSGPLLAQDIQDKSNKVDRMLNFLVQSNSIWNKQTMINRVRLIFTDVHSALEAGTLFEVTEAELYPAIAEQFNQTMSLWKGAGKTIEYRNFCVRKVEILLVKSFDDKSKNEFTARVSAHAQRIQKQNGNVLTQDNDVTFFEEYWTFGLLDGQWKLKEAMPKAEGKGVIHSENLEEGSSADLVKWYYTKKRAL